MVLDGDALSSIAFGVLLPLRSTVLDGDALSSITFGVLLNSPLPPGLLNT